MTYLYEIEEARHAMEAAQRAYLKRFGWENTSCTPGAYWMWRRDFADLDAKSAEWHVAHPTASPHVPYGIITAPQDMAIRMTASCLDQQEELNEDGDLVESETV